MISKKSIGKQSLLQFCPYNMKLAEATRINRRDMYNLITRIKEKLNHNSVFCSVTSNVGHVQECLCLSVSAGWFKLQCLIPRLLLYPVEKETSKGQIV